MATVVAATTIPFKRLSIQDVYPTGCASLISQSKEYVTGDRAGSTLVATAGRDLNVIAGVIGNGGTDGATFIAATRNLNLGTVTTAASNNLKWDDKNHRSDSESTEIGSQIQVSVI